MQAWISTARSNSVTVFDAARRSKIATIPVGSMPVGIEISPDGRHAFVANTNDNKVTVIEVKARKAIRSFATGNEPDGMAWAP
jgi:YVTN family beta-propeller protein